jgi:hypothetical protein
MIGVERVSPTNTVIVLLDLGPVKWIGGFGSSELLPEKASAIQQDDKDSSRSAGSVEALSPRCQRFRSVPNFDMAKCTVSTPVRDERRSVKVAD